MLLKNLNYLLQERGALPLSEEGFLALSPTDVWDLVAQLGVPFEKLNRVDLGYAAETAKKGKIKLIVLDVDGVFTDGGMIFSSSGEESKKFDVKDGMAIVRASAKSFEFGIISAAARDEVVRARAAVLGVKHVYVGKEPKLEVLESWLYEMGLGFENVAYIGDDINDVDILKKVGIGACPADAADQAKSAADIILKKNGGHGCIREFIEAYITAID